MSDHPLSRIEREALYQIAEAALDNGVRYSAPLNVTLDGLTPTLQALGATFVTLERGGELRGCVGTLQAHQPIAQDVADNAFAAGFQDKRFPPLSEIERQDITVKIVLLTAPHRFDVDSEADCLAKLRPHEDGIILQDQDHLATFLPTVWEQLPDPADFLNALKVKAGLPEDYWSDTMAFHRYETVPV